MTLYSLSTTEHNSQSENKFEKHQICLEDIQQGQYPRKLINAITAFVHSFPEHYLCFDVDPKASKIYVHGKIVYDFNMDSDDDDEADGNRHHFISTDNDAGDLSSYMDESDTSSCIKQETDTDDDSYEGINYEDISFFCIDPVPDPIISNAEVRMIDMKQHFREDSENSTETVHMHSSAESEPGLPIEPPKKKIKLEHETSSASDLTNDEESTYMSSDGAVFSEAAPPGPKYSIIYRNDDNASLISMMYKANKDPHGRELLVQLERGCSVDLLDELIESNDDDDTYVSCRNPTRFYSTNNTLQNIEATPINMEVCFVAVEEKDLSRESAPDTSSTEHSLTSNNTSYASVCSHSMPNSTKIHTQKHGEEGGIITAHQGSSPQRSNEKKNTKTGPLNPNRTNVKTNISSSYTVSSQRPRAERFAEKPYGKRTTDTYAGQNNWRRKNTVKQYSNRVKEKSYGIENSGYDAWTPVTNRQRRIQYQGLRYFGTKQTRDPVPKRNFTPGTQTKNSRIFGDARRYRTPGNPLFRMRGEPWISRSNGTNQANQSYRKCTQVERTVNPMAIRPPCNHRQGERPNPRRFYPQNQVHQRLEKNLNKRQPNNRPSLYKTATKATDKSFSNYYEPLADQVEHVNLKITTTTVKNKPKEQGCYIHPQEMK
jgi:hypothetical protein